MRKRFNSRILIVTLASLLLATLFVTTNVTADDIPSSEKPTIIEAEKCLADGAIIFRDKRASAGQTALRMLPTGNMYVTPMPLIKGKSAPLPAGDYIVTAWLEVQPISVQHRLYVHLTVGASSRDIKAAQFNPVGYTPIMLHVLHPGGPMTFAISANTDVGFNGMRAGQTAEEKATLGSLKPKTQDLTDKKADPAAENFDIEEFRDVTSLKLDETHIVCDKLEIKPICLSAAQVTLVDVDKIHYLPGETVHGTCTLQALSANSAGSYKLVAELINEIDHSRIVLEREVQLEAKKSQSIDFDFKLDDVVEFGHELRCSLQQSGKTVHANNQVFGVSKNVYRIGITGTNGDQDRSHWLEKDIDAEMLKNKKIYANFFECFAWAPCDYSNLTPQTEEFFSGQTQYHGSVTAFKNLMKYAHKYGVKCISYAKNMAGGIEGSKTYMRHPDWFWEPCEVYDTFYMERMHFNEYLIDQGDGKKISFQHWPGWAVEPSVDAAVDYGCDEIVRSVRMFGWDGIRWDGHFVDHMNRFKTRMATQIPNFIHGYNVAMADPDSLVFLPTLPVSDFHEIAKDHGLIMDESVRDWSNTNFSNGLMRPWYESVCREADYVKRIGGLPLFITCDMATPQDQIHNVIYGLAAGERYTNVTTIGDFNSGPFTRFLTRYSAFIWDDTARIKNAGKIVTVTLAADQIPKPVPPPVPDPAALPTPPAPKGKVALPVPPPSPWYDHSTWLRKLPDGNQQLLVNLVNAPNYPQYCNRVQTPPTIFHDLTIKVAIPVGAKLIRAVDLSIDNPDGLIRLDSKLDSDGQSVTVILPELRLWSIVVFEFGSATATPLTYPVYELTTPVEDAGKVLADLDTKKALAEAQAIKKDAAGVGEKPILKTAGLGWFNEYSKPRNVDLEPEKKMVKPPSIAPVRNGVLDVMHIKGLYSWLNPIDNALGLVGGGNLRSVYTNHAYFRLGPDGCLENFPATFRELQNQDVVILDNNLSVDMSAKQRIMMADFVRGGGGLVILGGCNSLSGGRDFNSYLGELLPIKIRKANETFHDDKGMNFSLAKPDPAAVPIFDSSIDWTQMQAFCVDVSPLRENVQVIVKVNDRPAIVTWNYGKGRVICFLINTLGDYPDGARPYWLSSYWTQILADATRWAAGDFKAVTKAIEAHRDVDPTKSTPEDLLLNADALSAEDFTRKLGEARSNVIDSTGAMTMIQAAIAGSDKIMDRDLLVDIVNDMIPYVDDSFAPLAEKMIAKQYDYFRVAGFTLLRYCSSPKYRILLESTLRETNPQIVRQALAALARTKDPASIPAIKTYLENKGTERLLALTALRMMGDHVDMTAVLPEYVKGFGRVTAMTAERKVYYEILHGGTSFKLTLAEARKNTYEFNRYVRLENEAIFDVTQFRSTLSRFTDEDARDFTRFVATSDYRAAATIAFAALPNFSPTQLVEFRTAMASAKLPQLRQRGKMNTERF